MRISKESFNQKSWAGQYTVGKERTKAGRRVSVRWNKPGPHGEKSMPMEDIVTWPFSVSIVHPDIDTMTQTLQRYGPTVG